MINSKKRQREIYLLIKDNHSVRVSDLEKKFNVSAPTIRKDLTVLEKNGLVQRSHGFAEICDDFNTVRLSSFDSRSHLNLREKTAIARKAVKYINDGDSIILNAGTTTLEIAKLLTGRQNLIIFTNSLSAASVFDSSRVSINIISGVYFSDDFATRGPDAEHYLRSIRVSKAFISSSGIRTDYGLACSDSLNSSLLQAMTNASEKVFALLDSSKLIKSNIYPSVSFQDIDYLITDSEITDDALCSSLKRAGTSIIVA